MTDKGFQNGNAIGVVRPDTFIEDTEARRSLSWSICRMHTGRAVRPNGNN
jgi:hypothetical protein